MILPKHYKTLILVTGLVLVALFIWLIGWYFLSDQATTLESTATEIAVMEQEQSQITGLRQEVTEVEDLIDKLNDLFIDQTGLVSFIERLETQAAGNGIDFEARNINIGTDQVTFDLRLAGRQAELERFLGQLAGLPFLIRFDNFTFRLIRGEAVDNWSADMTITLMSFIEQS